MKLSFLSIEKHPVGGNRNLNYETDREKDDARRKILDRLERDSGESCFWLARFFGRTVITDA